MITTTCYLIAGILIGWLLRWWYTKMIFDALKGELIRMKQIVSDIENQAILRTRVIENILKKESNGKAL